MSNYKKSINEKGTNDKSKHQPGNIKQDINFLEKPIWFQDSRFAEKVERGYFWKDLDGYSYLTSYKLTVKVDYVFLSYLILKSQYQGWANQIIVTRYEVVKNCSKSISSQLYARLLDSLDRWANVRLIFKGNFFDGKSYETLNFGIVDAWGIQKDTGKLWIRFSPEWIKKIENSQYYKWISFNVIKNFRSPLVLKLYTILIKSFQNRNKWKIDALKLASKIPLKVKYASLVVEKIRPAVLRIRNKTDLNVHLELDKKKRGTIILIFILKRDSQPDKQGKSLRLPTIQKEEPLLEVPSKIINIIPPKYFKLVKEIILKKCKEKGVNYVRKAIEYVNSMDPSNYSAYLANTLKKGYGDSFDPETKKYINVKKESQNCFQSCKGSCGARWDTHKENKTSICYWCKKFERPRNGYNSR